MKKIDAETRVSLKNILFATDFSQHSMAALPFALSIAREYGSHIYVVHVVSLSPFPTTSPTQAWQATTSQALREARQAMEAVEPHWKDASHENLIRKGDIWTELSTVIEDKQIDLVITGTRGRAGVSKLLIGSVAEKIFRHASCPVLTVGPNIAGEPESIVDIHTILYPTDFSPQSLAAAPYAISLAQENQAHLYLLHVTPSPVDAHTELGLKTALRDLVPPEAELWCEPKAFVESGDPAQKILEAIDELAADLVILGTRRMPTLPGASRLAMATAYKVVREAICPVFTVRG
jgi:nucleotide-binding universal stress UspA family protein